MPWPYYRILGFDNYMLVTYYDVCRNKLFILTADANIYYLYVNRKERVAFE